MSLNMFVELLDGCRFDLNSVLLLCIICYGTPPFVCNYMKLLLKTAVNWEKSITAISNYIIVWKVIKS